MCFPNFFDYSEFFLIVPFFIKFLSEFLSKYSEFFSSFNFFEILDFLLRININFYFPYIPNFFNYSKILTNFQIFHFFKQIFSTLFENLKFPACPCKRKKNQRRKASIINSDIKFFSTITTQKREEIFFPLFDKC